MRETFCVMLMIICIVMTCTTICFYRKCNRLEDERVQERADTEWLVFKLTALIRQINGGRFDTDGVTTVTFDHRDATRTVVRIHEQPEQKG